MSLEDERSDLSPKLPPLRPPTPEGHEGSDAEANQPARRSGLYIALGMIMLLTVLVYLNMG